MLSSIDVSTWDGGAPPLTIPVDWQAYARAGWMPAFIKVSEGLYIDRMFRIQWEAARNRVHRSGYHFFRPFVDPVAAADSFLAFLGDDRGELPPVLDLEARDGMDAGIVAQRALTWLGTYTKRTGDRPIVYSSPGFLGDIAAGNYPQFAEYKLWLAAYSYDRWSVEARTAKIKRVLTGQDPFIPYSPIPAPFTRITFQQWTAFGNPLDVPGYYTGDASKEAVDFNFYLGADIMTEFNLSPISEVPVSIYTVTTQRPSMSIRADHNTGANKINSVPNAGTNLGASEIWTAPADLFNSSGVKINQAGDKWAKLDAGGWIAITHLGLVYCTYKQNVPDPAPIFPASIETVQTLVTEDGAQATYKGTLTRQS